MTKEHDFSKGNRGVILGPGGSKTPIEPDEAGKTRITIRIDSDVLAWFKDQADSMSGGSYQALINRVLREQMNGAALAKSIRSIVRAELKRAGVGGKR